jgi:hypothetical protein
LVDPQPDHCLDIRQTGPKQSLRDPESVVEFVDRGYRSRDVPFTESVEITSLKSIEVTRDHSELVGDG